MGYDMTLERTSMTPEQVAAKDNAQQQFDLACKRRDTFGHGTPEFDAAHREVQRWYDEMYTEDLDYFRLNIWGMSTMRRVMDELNMVYYSQSPGWPTISGVADDAKWKIEQALEEGTDTSLFAPEDVAKVARYREIVDEQLRWVMPDTPGVMIHKLGSNDGWLVTEPECKSVVMRWTESTPENRDAIIWGVCSSEGFDSKQDAVEWVARWIAFIERGSRSGGFRVF